MKMIKKYMYLDFLVCLILSASVFTAYILSWHPTEKLEYLIYDLGSRIRQTESVSPVVAVVMDDESVRSMGRWPWPRSRFAQMVNTLSQAGAKVIGLDMLLSDEEGNQGLAEIRVMISNMESDSPPRKNIESDPVYLRMKESEKRLDHDSVLASSIAESGRVLLPLYFSIGNVAAGAAEIPPYLKANSVALQGAGEIFSANRAISPLPPFAQNALALGHVNALPDDDGILRREQLLVNYENLAYPSFALQLSLKYLNYDIKDVKFADGLRIGSLLIPADEKGRMFIAFNRGFQSYSFSDVANGRTSPSAFRDKIVLVAEGFSRGGNVITTPTGGQGASWLAVASVIDNILRRHYVTRPPWASNAEMALIVLAGLIVAICMPLLKIRTGAVVCAALIIALIGGSLTFFVAAGYWVKTAGSALLVFAGYLAVFFRSRLLRDKGEKFVTADDAETNKMLAISFQGQGMLDMAFEKLKKCPRADESVREHLYKLGLDFEKKRMFGKARTVYEYIVQAGGYMDSDVRATKFGNVADTMVFGIGSGEAAPENYVEKKPTLGRYEIIRELGRGAMGAVFLGRDPRINREVAIKTLRYEEIDIDQLDDVKKRFFREAEAAGKLSHPNIITIYDVGEDADIAYMAMEFLEGTNLTKYCIKGSLLPFPEVVRIVTLVAGALDYAHENGVVHRDIKPANIMILKNGDIRVADFGIARVVTTSKTQTGMILGTPSYMSPEQITGQKVDGRSDLFSLGVVFYELLSGQKPFDGDSVDTLTFSITHNSPQPLKTLKSDLPEQCVVIVDRLLEKVLERRYLHGREVVRDLAQYNTATQERT